MDHDLAPWAHTLVNALVAMGMLAIVPLGLRLSGRMPSWWFAAALPGAVALWLPRGWLAAALAIVYALGTTALVWRVPRVFTIANIAVATAYLSLSVASYSLVAERAGYPLMGFGLDLLALTVAHFHYAGFAAALIAGLIATAATHPWGNAAALSVPAGTAVVFAGYFLNDTVELAGALILSLGMWIVAWLLWRQIRIIMPALMLAASMLLALDWAWGHVVAVPHPSVNWMVATHGLLNATGFALCTLLALRKVRRHDLAYPDVTYPEVGQSLADPMPPGYHHLRYKTLIGQGPSTMDAAAEALLSLEIYRRIGLRADMAEKRARVGATVVVHLGFFRGFFRAPCQFVWVADSSHLAGWGYGTLRGHPEQGEESFILTRDREDQVWLEVRSFSRPGAWYTKLAGPLIPMLQQRFVRRCGRALQAR